VTKIKHLRVKPRSVVFVRKSCSELELGDLVFVGFVHKTVFVQTFLGEFSPRCVQSPKCTDEDRFLGSKINNDIVSGEAIVSTENNGRPLSGRAGTWGTAPINPRCRPSASNFGIFFALGTG